MKLVSIADLAPSDIRGIWALASVADARLHGTVGWSFEGNGIRTRTSFLEAFRSLGLQFTELPNLLKTDERVEDLAGYLDPYFSHYVIRAGDHERLRAFAHASKRPVINAMSSQGHPCEVLADAYHVEWFVRPLRDAVICLWGPTTNVFRSWHELARVLDLRVVQVCDVPGREDDAVRFVREPPSHADVVVTDAWPHDARGTVPLSEAHLVHMGRPALMPTPPFTVGRELAIDPLQYPGFVGYHQKQLLLPVQRAILQYVSGVRSA